MKWILIILAFCFGTNCYMAVGLALLFTKLPLFSEVRDAGDAEDYWLAMAMWPMILIASFVVWTIELIGGNDDV